MNSSNGTRNLVSRICTPVDEWLPSRMVKCRLLFATKRLPKGKFMVNTPQNISCRMPGEKPLGGRIRTFSLLRLACHVQQCAFTTVHNSRALHWRNAQIWCENQISSVSFKKSWYQSSRSVATEEQQKYTVNRWESGIVQGEGSCP
jgi:hypothetical protein